MWLVYKKYTDITGGGGGGGGEGKMHSNELFRMKQNWDRFCEKGSNACFPDFKFFFEV